RPLRPLRTRHVALVFGDVRLAVHHPLLGVDGDARLHLGRGGRRGRIVLMGLRHGIRIARLGTSWNERNERDGGADDDDKRGESDRAHAHGWPPWERAGALDGLFATILPDKPPVPRHAAGGVT